MSTVISKVNEALKLIAHATEILAPLVTENTGPAGSSRLVYNPFVAWYGNGPGTEGHKTLEHLMLWDFQIMHREQTMTKIDWEQAIAAGYPAPELMELQAAVDFSGYDFNIGPDGKSPRLPGQFLRNTLLAGAVSKFKFPALGKESAFQLGAVVQADLRPSNATKVLLWIENEGGTKVGAGGVIGAPVFATIAVPATLIGQFYLCVEPDADVRMDVRYDF